MSDTAEPVHVVHVITRLILGGAQENTLLTCEGLAADPAWKVTLLSGPAEGPEGDLVSRARRSGLDLRIIPTLQRELHPIRDAAALQSLFEAFQSLRPRIVHTHSSKAGFLGRLAANWAGVPGVVHSIHGLPFHPYESAWRNSLYRWCERRAAGWAHRLVSVADAMTDQAVAAGVAPRSKFITIRSGMEMETFERPHPEAGSIRTRFGIPSGVDLVTCVARLFPHKGHGDLLEAMERVIGKRPATHLLLVGDGILRASLEGRASRGELAGRVHFAGLVAPDLIPACLQASDVVVHPSYREGLARVIPQALLAGKPVVSYDVDGAREVVEDGVTGRRVRPGDVEALAGATLDLLANRSGAAAMAERGRVRCRGMFDHRKMVEEIKGCYLDLLRG
ncbi:MAG: glycosyltransferase family 4 protein [Planctomycetes bacterium]|nr:glycosyltransferase family 4 protein [Planctomycetota bacterium]